MFTFFMVVLITGIMVQKLISYAKQHPAQVIETIRKLLGR